MATGRERGIVELRLVAIAPDGTRHDLSVEATPDAAARELLSALAAELDLDPETAVARKDGVPLPRDAPLSELGLRQGDELWFGPREQLPARAAPVDLVVDGGPDSGRRTPLQVGANRVGGDAPVALDDPSLSAHHLVLTVQDDGSVAVADTGSRNGTGVEGVALAPGEERSLARDELVQAGRTLLRVEPHEDAEPAGASVDGNGRIPFNRPPGVQRPLEASTRTCPAPPNDPHRARIPLAASLIPLVLGVVLYLVTHLPSMLFFSLLAPVMAVTSTMEGRRSGRQGFEQHRREYRRRLAELRDELDAARRDEVARRRAQAPSAPELLRRVRRLESTVWERRFDDRNFLALRVGSADQPALLAVEIEAGGNDDLRREAEELAAWYSTVPAVPVVVPVAELGVVGLCGPAEQVGALGRWLVAQAAALHSPSDLAIVAAVGADRLDEWDWLKWLPHTQGAPARLAADRAAAHALLEELGRIVAERRADTERSYGTASRRRPHILLVLEEEVAPERGLVGELLAAADHGFSVLWLGHDRRELPGACAGIVELDRDAARLTYTDADGGEWADVSADGLGVELARELALALAPVNDTGGSRSQAIPDRVALVDLLGADEPDADWVRRRWATRDDRLDAVIGMAASGPFSVDLRADGPHGLVAGMTGAGKSEFLQTLIASLATAHPPNRLAFLLVDYKGGAAFKDCARLPHTVGLVTDLDAHLTQRALASLNAELQRRERILLAVGAPGLADMERTHPEDAPPSLLIVIDEFATLAAEVPDFVDGIIDVARRGRSLGVHLLLATQRPGGIVSENIRANTNLRIALRVNEAAESSDVIGVPDAARISRDRPGRLYVRTGHSDLNELQTAYVGAATVHATREAPVIVRPFAFAGAGTSVAAGGAGETDLARLVEAVAEAARRSGIEAPPSPWLPPLEPVLPLDALTPPEDAGIAVLGLADEPLRQRQRPLTLDLEQQGSLLVYGTSRAGKTTLLRTLALSLAERAAPEELHLYGLDFATGGLAPLSGLPHTGAVVAGEDTERVERLFALLRRTLERRKVLFAQAGAFTLAEFRRSADTPMPRIVVLLDGYANFAAAFERVDLGALVDALPRLVADGRPLGIHFAITADRRGAVPNALAGIVPTKIILRMADEDEFAALGIPPKVVHGAQLPPGRGFLPDTTEVHIALGDLQDRAAGLRDKHPGAIVPAIEPLATEVPRGPLPAPDRRWAAVLGRGDAELEPVTIDLSNRHFLVVGPYRTGRSTALRTIVESLRASTPGLELHLLAPRRSPLTELEGWSSVARGSEACQEAALRLGELVAAPLRAPVLVVIDDGDEFAETLGAEPLELVARRGRDVELRILAAVERSAAQRAFSGWVRELRKEEHGLLLNPDLDVDGEILGTRLPRRSSPVFPPGRGYLVDRGIAELVHVAS